MIAAKQTDRQTDGDKHAHPATLVGVSNEKLCSLESSLVYYCLFAVYMCVCVCCETVSSEVMM